MTTITLLSPQGNFLCSQVAGPVTAAIDHSDRPGPALVPMMIILVFILMVIVVRLITRAMKPFAELFRATAAMLGGLLLASGVSVLLVAILIMSITQT
jgi:hypothetical protein